MNFIKAPLSSDFVRCGGKGKCELVGFGGHVSLVGFVFLFFSNINLHLFSSILLLPDCDI